MLNRLKWYTPLGDVMKPLKNKISITLDDPVLEAIRDMAEREDRSVSSYINLVLKDHVEKKRQGK